MKTKQQHSAAVEMIEKRPRRPGQTLRVAIAVYDGTAYRERAAVRLDLSRPEAVPDAVEAIRLALAGVRL